VPMGAGLRPTTKGVDEPPDPTVCAPVLDPTEVAGDGNQDRVRASEALLPRKRGATGMPSLRSRRHPLTLLCGSPGGEQSGARVDWGIVRPWREGKR